MSLIAVLFCSFFSLKRFLLSLIIFLRILDFSSLYIVKKNIFLKKQKSIIHFKEGFEIIIFKIIQVIFSQY